MKNSPSRPILWIIVPCYDEQEVLPVTAPLFRKELQELIDSGRVSSDSRILFVNDGSKDDTWKIVTKLTGEDEHYIGIALSRNRGHQNVVLAGLMEAKDRCDITISIDCDGQDDISAMGAMVDKYLNGCEIVYGVRSSREADSWFKRTSAQGYYRFLNRMGCEVVYNCADYRLVSSRVLQSFADFKEVNLFLRGMFPLVGFKSTSVYYERHERMAGKSHYPLRKMLSLAVDGVTSLSIKPISIIAAIGIVVSLLGLIGIVWAIVMAVLENAVAGWGSIVCIMCFLSGVQLLSLGIIGEYVGKAYMESKHRPRYIISERTWEGKFPPH